MHTPSFRLPATPFPPRFALRHENAPLAGHSSPVMKMARLPALLPGVMKMARLPALLPRVMKMARLRAIPALLLWGAGLAPFIASADSAYAAASQFFADSASGVLFVSPSPYASGALSNAPILWANGELHAGTFPVAEKGRAAFLGYRPASTVATNAVTFRVGTNAVLRATIETTRDGGFSVLAATNLAPVSAWATNLPATLRFTWNNDGGTTQNDSQSIGNEYPAGGSIASNTWTWTALESAGGHSFGPEIVYAITPRLSMAGRPCGASLSLVFNWYNDFSGATCSNYVSVGSNRWRVATRGAYADFPFTGYTVSNEFDLPGVADSPATTRYVDALPRLVFESGGLAVYTNGVRAGSLTFSP